MDGASSIYGGFRPNTIAKAESDRHGDPRAAFIRRATRHPNAHGRPTTPISYAAACADGDEHPDAVHVRILKTTPRRGYLCFTCPRIKV
jgi:hypothetical protein